MHLQQVKFEAAFGTFAQLPKSDLPEVAFAGRSNVGKSSLLNCLFRRKSLARVSSVPGKTVTVNFYLADGVRFVDLPGYGYAKVAKSEKQRWSELMEGYFRSGRDIRLVVQLVDMRHPPTKDDLGMLEFLQANGYEFAVVLTKSDKLNKTEYQNRLALAEKELPQVPRERLIPFSTVRKEGAEQLLALIEQFVR